MKGAENIQHSTFNAEHPMGKKEIRERLAKVIGRDIGEPYLDGFVTEERGCYHSATMKTEKPWPHVTQFIAPSAKKWRSQIRNRRERIL